MVERSLGEGVDVLLWPCWVCSTVSPLRSSAIVVGVCGGLADERRAVVEQRLQLPTGVPEQDPYLLDRHLEAPNGIDPRIVGTKVRLVTNHAWSTNSRNWKGRVKIRLVTSTVIRASSPGPRMTEAALNAGCVTAPGQLT
jgi:hypothetical protein